MDTNQTHSTETQAPTTPRNTEPRSTNTSVDLKLRTYLDPVLVKLEGKAKAWFKRYLAEDRPCWLTLCGPSGTGKSHVGNRLWETAKAHPRVLGYQGAYFPRKIWWPGFVNKLRSGNAYEELEETRRWPLLYLDEIGANRDTTGFVADQLAVILGQREAKWTIITTNLLFEQIGELDARIASRCIRNQGVVVEVKTVDFSTRYGTEPL